jgi:lysophospholipase L1-like esterase
MTFTQPAKALGFWSAAFVALLQVGPAQAQDKVSFVSGPSISDLVCPNIAQQPKPPSTPSSTPRTAPLTGSQMPTDAELGPLRRLVIRNQPLIAPQDIPGLTIQDAGTPHRIAFWGDSHIAAGPFMPTMIDVLRSRGLSVGTRYLPPSMGRANTRLPGLHGYCIGQAWTTELSFTASATLATGPGLLNRLADAGPESYLWLDLRDNDLQPTVKQLKIVYRAPAGGTLDLSVNNGVQTHATLNASDESQTLTISGDAPISTIKLQVAQGKVVLHGFMLDYARSPAVTVDVFGLPSATARGWANVDPDYLAQTLKGVEYDGVVMEYGTNEGNDPDFDRDKYAAGLSKALTNMRQIFPSASCVLVGPPDRGVLMQRNGRAPDLLKFGRIHQQIENLQQQVGKQFNCTAWNWQDLMGGPGGSYGWGLATPPLMGRDLTHLSPEGYRRTAHALARSLGWEN